jgi:chromosome condensin MukBEF ATPase and DNA-binding subunit MukB
VVLVEKNTLLINEIEGKNLKIEKFEIKLKEYEEHIQQLIDGNNELSIKIKNMEIQKIELDEEIARLFLKLKEEQNRINKLNIEIGVLNVTIES